VTLVVANQISKEELEVAAFRLPKRLRSRAKAKAHAEDLTFSQLMRRAIRRELEKASEAK